MILLDPGLRAVLRAVAVLLVLMPAASRARAQALAPEIVFYLTDAPDAFASFEAHALFVSVIAPQSFRVNARGDLEGRVAERVLELARARGIRVMPLIVNPGWNLELFHTMVNDSAARARMIERMVTLGRQHGFWGWQFDFEQIHIDDRAALTRFYRETARALHAAGMKLSIAVYPDPDARGDTATSYHKYLRDYFAGAYDLAALAEAGDFISVMTYLQHSAQTPPGPVGGLPYMERVVQHALGLGVPPEKISLGIPFFSMHWSAQWNEERKAFSGARGMGWPAAQRTLRENGVTAVWDSAQASNHAHWERGGTFEHAWVEDARALAPKLALQQRLRLRGISVWRMGQEDPAVWKLFEQWAPERR
jgi:spore germination protein